MLNTWILCHSPVEEGQPEAYESMRLLEEGQKMGLSIKAVHQDHFDMVLEGTGKWSAYYEGHIAAKPDLIIARTGSETNYNGFALMRFYQRMNVPVVNSVEAMERTTDKLFTQKILTSNGIAMPKTMLARLPINLDIIENELGFPVVLKVLRGTRGRGIVLCDTRDHLRDTLDLLSDSGRDVQVLLQRYVAASHGRDYRLFVVDGKVLACIERQSAGDSFKSNVSLGGYGTKFTPTAEMEKLAIDATREMGLTVAGVDLLQGENRYMVCEVNASPGFQGLEGATGVNAAKAVLEASLKSGRRPTLLGQTKSLFGRLTKAA